MKVVSEIRDSAAKKITAKKISGKYKKMRNAKNKKNILGRRRRSRNNRLYRANR